MTAPLTRAQIRDLADGDHVSPEYVIATLDSILGRLERLEGGSLEEVFARVINLVAQIDEVNRPRLLNAVAVFYGFDEDEDLTLRERKPGDEGAPA